VPARAVLSNGLHVVVWSNGPAIGNAVTATVIRVKRVQGEPLADARVAGAISDCGARNRVQATGVGAPRSDSTVMMPSPMPSWVSSSSRS